MKKINLTYIVVSIINRWNSAIIPLDSDQYFTGFFLISPDFYPVFPPIFSSPPPRVLPDFYPVFSRLFTDFL